ncbi:MAG: acyl-CoA reductase [Chitinophagaceae bacterium]|nr:acyl-CoA reductase [Chitinophagaceae bacterium]
MNLQHRINLMIRLGEYMSGNEQSWTEAKMNAGTANGWFIPQFVNLAGENIVHSFLQPAALQSFADKYKLQEENNHPVTVGVVMAGNIPMVGFHDFLCILLSGHHLLAKLSSKDDILMRHLINKLQEWEPELKKQIVLSEMLKGCAAYIATGSNNSARYFDYYFKKYPHLIRRNRTSAAILTGSETTSELGKLSDDVHLYFGLGCRNVTHIYVPQGYDFIPLIEIFKKYNYFFDHSKYKNNYDYQLAIHLLNNNYYMSSGSILLSENPSLFSPVSQLNYSFYQNIDEITAFLQGNQELQCVVGRGFVPFGQAQTPALTEYADGADTMEFLKTL